MLAYLFWVLQETHLATFTLLGSRSLGPINAEGRHTMSRTVRGGVLTDP